jgi:hypothetical protein
VVIQLRNKEHDDLHKTQLLGCTPEWWMEPLGGQGVFNGAFEHWKNDIPVGWEVYYENATSTFSQQTGAPAGNYCVRGGNSAANQRGSYIYQVTYMPVNEDRNYNIYGEFRGSAAGCTFYFGAACYTAAKVFINYSSVAAAVAPGVAWASESHIIGPAGTAWQANTRYCRVFIYLQYDNGQAAGAYIEAGDIFWRPEP